MTRFSFLPIFVLLASMCAMAAGLVPAGIKSFEDQLINKAQQDQYGWQSELCEYMEKNPASLNYPFSRLSKQPGISLLTSPDGKVRIVSFDTHMGGSSRSYASVIQYNDGPKIHFSGYTPGAETSAVTTDEIPDGEGCEPSYIMDLYQIDNGQGAPVYLTIGYYSVSSGYGAYEACAFQIKNGKTQKLQFKDHEGNIENTAGLEIALHYDDNGFKSSNQIIFDSKTKSVYVPEDTNGTYTRTDRYDIYRLSNGVFSYVGTDAGFWLYPGLKNFKSLHGMYYTATKTMRVDKLKDGSYRYACWAKGKALSTKPELILQGGHLTKDGKYIEFNNGEYQYLVPTDPEGNSSSKIIIKRNGKTIQTSPLSRD